MKKTINLNGVYHFLLDSEKKGLEAHYEKMSFTDTIELPTTTSAAGKGPVNEARETGFLTDLHAFEGYAWFQTDLTVDPGDLGRTAILTLERTRVSYVFVDDHFVGTNNSLCTSHQYDLTEYLTGNSHTLTIMVSNVDYPVKGGHMTSPDTQTNWNGILGNMTLTFYDSVRILKLRTDCEYEIKRAVLSLQLTSDKAEKAPIEVTSRLLHLESGATNSDATGTDTTESDAITASAGAPALHMTESLTPGEHTLTLSYPLGEDARVWDEFDPYVYEITVTAGGDTATTLFGLKKFEARKTHFYINDSKTFLRGKHDGMIFPITGYAPMDVEGWLRVMSTSKSFGINHYRFHTCCPPDAAFIAADLLGIYMQPELPFWGTFTVPGDEGHDEAGQQYLIEEGFRILDSFANHPSFVMMSMGNELWGSPEAINALLGRYKAVRPNILFTQGSNNFQWVPNIQPNDDFFSGVRFTIDRQIRGSYAMCDKPLGHVQTSRPGTDFNYEEAIFPSYQSAQAEADADGMIEIQYGTGVKKVKLTDAQGELIPSIPVISHEIGQYETFPDFTEIDQYTGVLRARNFEVFREHLDQKGLLLLAPRYFKASGALAAACYKDELETALRTKDMAGFQILDIQDFTGQGTALVGMLNAFMENKGIITDSKWRTFCSEAVVQAEFATYLYRSGDKMSANITLSYYGRVPLKDPVVTCTFLAPNASEWTPETFLLSYKGSVENGVTQLGSISYPMPDVKEPTRLTLQIGITGTTIINSYELTLFPAEDPAITSSQVVTNVADVLPAAASQKNVLLLLDPASNPNSIEGTYCTDFWCYPMFCSISDWMKKERPVGTMGLLIQKEHPALSLFPTEDYSTPQWWDIVTESRSTILDDTQILPIVQTIDNFERNHRLGLIYEIHLTDLNVNVVICTSPLQELIKKGRPEAAWLLKSLVQYVSSDQVQPEYHCTVEEFAGFFAAPVVEADAASES